MRQDALLCALLACARHLCERLTGEVPGAEISPLSSRWAADLGRLGEEREELQLIRGLIGAMGKR